MTDVADHLPREVRWSARAVRLDDGSAVLDLGADLVCETASIGKVLLLLAVAEQITTGALDASDRLPRPVEPVADSGLWQHLRSEPLSVADACALVGAVSDNLATNALVGLVGLRAVADTAARLGLHSTGLHDIVRDVRTAADPPALSTASAGELATLCALLHRQAALSPQASSLVTDWLRLNCDLSMVASALGADPLAHVARDRTVRLWNKTGTNVGVRCDIGVVEGSHRSVAYAVLANWHPASDDDPVRDAVLAAMRDLGRLIRGVVQADR